MKKSLTKEEFNKLLMKIGQNKKHALKSFFNLYGRFIYWSSYSVCKSSSISDEVVNDVLLKIWQLSSTTQLEIENPEGWLYKISTNMAKKKKEEPILPLNEDIIETKNEIDRLIDEDVFYSYLKGLTDDEQFIFISRFIQDLKFEDIAAILEIPLSTLTTRYYRALNKIKQNIEKK